MSSTRSMSSSMPMRDIRPGASNMEIGLIFLGVIICLIFLGVIIFLFLRKKNTNQQSVSAANSQNSSVTSSNFAKINYDRQQEELKKQTQNSALNTPYITSAYNNYI